MPRRRHVEVWQARSRYVRDENNYVHQVEQWWFREVAANGNKGARSNQAYTRRDSAVRGARRAHPDLPIEFVDR